MNGHRKRTNLTTSGMAAVLSCLLFFSCNNEDILEDNSNITGNVIIFVLESLLMGMYRRGEIPLVVRTGTLPNGLYCGRRIRQIRFVSEPLFPTVFTHPFSRTGKP